MSHTIRIDRRHRSAPAARRTERPRIYRRAVLAVGTPLLMMTVTAGCTAQQSGQAGTESADATVDAVPRLAALPDNGPVPQGKYVVSVFDAPASAPWAPVLAVPEGYTNIDGTGVFADDIVSGANAVWLWDIQSVYTHPCDWAGYPKSVGPSVEDLAGALAAQPMRDATDPAAVTIGGYEGLYVELSTPDDIDFTTCLKGTFNSWPGRSQRDAGPDGPPLDRRRRRSAHHLRRVLPTDRDPGTGGRAQGDRHHRDVHPTRRHMTAFNDLLTWHETSCGSAAGSCRRRRRSGSGALLMRSSTSPSSARSWLPLGTHGGYRRSLRAITTKAPSQRLRWSRGLRGGAA